MKLIIRRILKEEITSMGFDVVYDNLLGSPYFKFINYDNWYKPNGKGLTDTTSNRILDSLTPTEVFNSYEEWKNSIWYGVTEFPFSSKDWTLATVKGRPSCADGSCGWEEKEKFKWYSTGHKLNEKKMFDSYLNKFGPFVVVDLTNK